MTGPEDEFEARLRRALRAEADTVHPAGDGLARIRARTAARLAPPWWRRPAALGLAAALAAAFVVGGALTWVGGPGGEIVATAPTPTTSAAPTTSPTASPEPSGSPEPTGSAEPTGSPSPGGEPTGGSGAPITVPVYYLSDVAGELRLYREFHRVPDAGGPARSALVEMLRGEPLDPDYDSVWPAGTRLLDYSVEGDTATVDLSREAREGPAGAEAEARSVQQLVYTVTAADPDVTRVRLLVEGAEVEDLWGHGAVGDQPVEREPMLDVQGLIWIIDPQQDADTSSPVTVRVFGTGFEGTVTLKVFHGAQEVEGTFVTTEQGRLAEGTTEITLSPGDYTIRAYDENAADGSLIERDSKDFTVR